MSQPHPTVLIGVGNPYRRDDGIGPALAAAIAERELPGVTVLTGDAEPSRLLDAWHGAKLAVLVDAGCSVEPVPGRVHRSVLPAGSTLPPPGSTLPAPGSTLPPPGSTLPAPGSTLPAPGSTLPAPGSASTHGLGIADAIALAQVVDRLPERLVLFTVEAADLGYGIGLSDAVAQSLPQLIQAVLAELTG